MDVKDSIKKSNYPNKHEFVKTEMPLSISTATSTKISLPIKQMSMPIKEDNFSATDNSIVTLKESTNNFIRKFSYSFHKNVSIQNGILNSKRNDDPVTGNHNYSLFIKNQDQTINEKILIQERSTLER